METGQENYNGGMIDQKSFARTSTVLGILMLAAWILPIAGLPLGGLGLILGIMGLTSSRRDLANAGIFMNGLGLGLTMINMIVTTYLLVTGKFDPLQFFQP